MTANDIMTPHFSVVYLYACIEIAMISISINLSVKFYEKTIWRKKTIYNFIYDTIRNLQKARENYLQNVKYQERQGTDPILEDIAFRIKITKCVPDLSVGMHGIIYNTKTMVHSSIILFSEQNI